MNYSEDRKRHLIKYAQSDCLLKNAVGGLWQGKGSPRDHILKMQNPKDKKEQREVIEKYQLNKFNLTLDFIPIGKQHIYAHHLNSSQILCYCYFRRMLDNEGHPNDKLISLMSQHGISISSSAICSFEYDAFDKYNDDSEIDFHIQDGDTEVFFEIKYTESKFGAVEVSEKYIKKFDKIYKNLLLGCQCLDSKMSVDDFCASYQLNRNVVRITSKDKYTIFLFPKSHSDLENEFKKFHETILEPYKDHVMALYWEDIITEDSEPELFEKYFK